MRIAILSGNMVDYDWDRIENVRKRALAHARQARSSRS